MTGYESLNCVKLDKKFQEMTGQLQEIHTIATSAKYEAQMAANRASETQEQLNQVELDIEDMKSGLWTRGQEMKLKILSEKSAKK